MAAEFIFPQYGNYSIEDNNQNINTFDTLYVQYRTSWPTVNLTLYCLQWNKTSNKPYFFDYPANPVPSSGLYDFGTIEAIGYWTVFPTSCLMRLTKTGADDTRLDGEIFWITRNSSAPATTLSPDAAQATASTTGSSSVASVSATVTSTAASTGIPAALASVSAAAVNSTVPSNSPGLSTGAKAGIAIGAILAVAILLGLGCFLWRRRRSSNGATGKHEVSNGQAYHEAPAEVYSNSANPKNAFTEKQEIDGTGIHELHTADKERAYELPS